MEHRDSDLILCMRSALLGEAADCNIATCLPLAQRHGVVHLLYYAISKSAPEFRPDEELCLKLKRKAYASMIREAAQQQKIEEIYARMEAKEITCLALKGISIKHLYPTPEMRFMSDVDILVDASKTADVREIFESLNYKVLNYDRGDTDLYLSPEGLPFEIKRTLREEAFNKSTDAFLDKLLSRTEPMKGYRFVRQLSNEDHYAYILCHIMKHMLNGGVGVRPIMDVWICKNQMELDAEKMKKLLDDLKLTTFAERMEHLAEVWFGTAEETPIDAELGAYILSSGSYGSEEHRVADRIILSKKKPNRLKYIWSRFFLPYESMCHYYPVLKKWAILLPAFWLWRMIYALIFRRQKLTEELGAVGDTNTKALQERLAFYQRCGIEISDK